MVCPLQLQTYFFSKASSPETCVRGAVFIQTRTNLASVQIGADDHVVISGSDASLSFPVPYIPQGCKFIKARAVTEVLVSSAPGVKVNSWSDRIQIYNRQNPVQYLPACWSNLQGAAGALQIICNKSCHSSIQFMPTSYPGRALAPVWGNFLWRGQEKASILAKSSTRCKQHWFGIRVPTHLCDASATVLISPLQNQLCPERWAFVFSGLR